MMGLGCVVDSREWDSFIDTRRFLMSVTLYQPVFKSKNTWSGLSSREIKRSPFGVGSSRKFFFISPSMEAPNSSPGSQSKILESLTTYLVGSHLDFSNLEYWDCVIPSWDETAVWVSPAITRRFFKGLVIYLLLIYIHILCIYMHCQPFRILENKLKGWSRLLRVGFEVSDELQDGVVSLT